MKYINAVIFLFVNGICIQSWYKTYAMTPSDETMAAMMSIQIIGLAYILTRENSKTDDNNLPPV